MYWRVLLPPISVSSRATRAHRMRPAQALLCWAVTGIVLSALWAGAGAAALEQQAAIACANLEAAIAGTSQPAGPPLRVANAFKLSSMMWYFAQGLPWMLAYYVLVSAVSWLMASAVVHYKFRRRRDNGRSSTALPTTVRTGVTKATAVSMSPVLWGVLVFAPFLFGLPFVWDPVVWSKLPSSLILSLAMLYLPVWGLGCLWAIVFSVLCGLRIARHLRRVRCVSCGYDLKGTLGDRCSECGMDLEIVSDA